MTIPSPIPPPLALSRYVIIEWLILAIILANPIYAKLVLHFVIQLFVTSQG